MPRLLRRKGWLIAPLILAAGLLMWTLMLPTSPPEPVYGGRSLSDWMHGHPREYFPVVRQIGTNALPFLLAELQAVDSGPARLGEKILGKFSMGPLWHDARDRHYHAGLALQILDTNAAPALVDMVLATPMHLTEGDPSSAAAASLGWLPSSNSCSYADRRLGEALRDPDPMKRRNAALAFSVWPHPSDVTFSWLLNLTQDTNWLVRAGAVRALLMCRSEAVSDQNVLVARLDDEQAAVRRLAIEALAARGTNSVDAVPALRAAYAAEPTRSGLRDTLEIHYFDDRALSSQSIRWAIRDAIKVIDPHAPLPP